MALNEKYLEEKFNRVFDQQDNIREIVEEVRTKVKETNGKVGENRTRIELLEKADIIHEVHRIENCPHTETINRIKEETEVTRFFGKYPKLLKYTSIGLGIMFLLSIASLIANFLL